MTTTSPIVRSSWLDALKGWAVIGVIATHAEQFIAPQKGFVQGLSSSGHYGVQLFFVLSAMTLMDSWNRRNDGIVPFFTRRIFRIVPLFWLAILLYGFLLGPQRLFWAGDNFDTIDLVLTASFLNVLSPNSLNNIVPGGWSITAEMAFYAAFPFVAPRILFIRSPIANVLIAAMATLVLNPLAYKVVEQLKGDGAAANFQFFWIGNQFTVFAIGLAAWRMRIATTAAPTTWKLAAGGAVAALALLSTVTQNLNIAYALVFAVLATAASKGGADWLANPVIMALGKRSYSAYVWHYIVMVTLWSPKLWTSGWTALPWFLGADNAIRRMLFLIGATMAITLALSTVTYKLVEHPSMRLGERIASYLAALRKRAGTVNGTAPQTT
jgi:peptidoglycan/LPS O-acetylase OafA/YrhL